MKVLILVIYSRNEAYDKMLEVQRKYMHNYKDVEVYFMESCFLHNESVFIQNDMSRVRIDEDNNTILLKTLATIECLHYVHRRHFDFVVRTNISTVIDIPKLVRILEKYQDVEYLYAGDLCGINTKIGHVWFATGTCIIMSRQLAIKMIHEQEKFDHSDPDDVAFAVFVTQHCPQAYDNDIRLRPFFYYTIGLPSGWDATLQEMIQFANQNGNKFHFICYRNKTHDRLEDAKIMDYICTNLIEK